MKMKMETRNKLINVLMGYNVSEREATDLTAMIIVGLCFVSLDWKGVAVYLAPTGEYSGIPDPNLRTQAAREWLRTYIAESSISYLGKWAGILMWVDNDETRASEWLRDHGYAE